MTEPLDLEVIERRINRVLSLKLSGAVDTMAYTSRDLLAEVRRLLLIQSNIYAALLAAHLELADLRPIAEAVVGADPARDDGPFALVPESVIDQARAWRDQGGGC